jgi:hypothetical protein
VITNNLHVDYMNQAVESAIDTYYKLKGKYDKNLTKVRMAIIRSPSLTPVQKKQKLQQIVPKCAKCGKQGGTVFESKDGVLSAICNAADKCNLRIEVNRGKMEDVRDMAEENDEDSLRLRKDIIVTKLLYLFGYVTEQEALNKFKSLESEYSDTEGLAVMFYKMASDKMNNTANKDKIADNRRILYGEKIALRKMADEYKKTGNERLIEDMVEKYIDVIEPLVKETRDLKYQYSAVECVNPLDSFPCKDTNYKLVEEVFTLSSMEFPSGADPVVIHNSEAGGEDDDRSSIASDDEEEEEYRDE